MGGIVVAGRMLGATRCPSRSWLPSACFAAFASLAAVPSVDAANGDCGQPLSNGASPTATDALFILRVAVGVDACDPCICDTDDSGSTNATDALRTLRSAVGVPVSFACPACEAASLCDGLVTIDETAGTFDTIDIGDVPNGFTALWAILTPTVGDEGVAPVLIDVDGNERLMVPLHPDGGVDGGTVAVSVTDGNEVCPIGSLEILPLPAAPADTGANVLAAYLALNDAIAADFGMTAAQLATTPLEQLPTVLIVPAISQILLAGPTNQNSFAAILAGTAPVLEGDTDLDLMNRVLARIGLESALDELLANRTSITPGVSSVRDERLAALPQQGQCGALLQPVELDISTAEELSRLMLEGQAARDGQTSLGNGVITDSIGMVFDVLGIVVRPARALGGLLLYEWAIRQEWLGNLYPSILTKLEFDVDDDGRIPEDRMDPGDGGPVTYPKWSNPRLYATNLGAEVTRAVLEDLLDALSFLPVPGSIEEDAILTATLEAANDAMEFLGNDGCRSVPPTTWGPVGEAYEPEYVEPLYFGSTVQQVDFGTFQPVALGTTQLRVRSTDAFSGPPVSGEKDVEVVRKRFSIQVPTITVEPGDPVEVIATIVDSYRPEKVDWDYPAFVQNPVKEQLGMSDHKLSFDSPTDRSRYPFEVRAFSTSISLDPQTPAREGKAQIKTEAGVTITSSASCVPNGTPVDLTAVVTGLAESEDDSVSWSQFGAGDLVPGADNTAVYTAPPSGEGEVLITATLDLDNQVMDEISLVYGSCAINLDLGWYAGSSTNDPDLPADVDQMKAAYYSGPLFPQPGDLLVPPASWWSGRSRMVSSSNGSTYLEPVRDDMGVMHDLPLSSSSQIDAELTSSGPEQAALSMSWSTSAECKAIPNSANGIACSSGLAQFDWIPVFWVELAEAGTYHARFTMDCSRSGSDGLYAVGARTNLSRHVGGAATPGFPNGGTSGPNISALNPFGTPTPPPLPFPVGQTNFVCEPGNPLDVEATWELGPPIDPSKPDIIALSITITAFLISPVDPFVVFDPPVGSYTQSGTVSGSITLTRTGP